MQYTWFFTITRTNTDWFSQYFHYNTFKWHFDACSRFATIQMGLKFGEGGLRPFWWKGTGSPSNTKSPGPRPTSIPSGIFIHAAIWPQKIWSKIGGLCPFRGAGARSPPNTMWPGPRPTCVPSFILICPTVWPQYTNVTDRTDRQTGQDRTDRQRTDSIGRTVLQAVAQKQLKIIRTYEVLQNYYNYKCTEIEQNSHHSPVIRLKHQLPGIDHFVVTMVTCIILHISASVQSWIFFIERYVF